jgi:multimeric flavodoxin WrbA
MTKAVAINGSPRMEKGSTALILNPFIQGMQYGGCSVELFFASKLKVLPCECGALRCWRVTPGECIYQDNMRLLIPELKISEILVIATPIYSPLPGDMQNILNRMVPLLKPELVWRDGRTRARFRDGIAIRKIVLVAVGGWWETENMDRLVNIIREFAETASVEFAGAVLRPHAGYMKKEGVLTEPGKAVVQAVKQAGSELVRNGKIEEGTLLKIRRPLIPEPRYISG